MSQTMRTRDEHLRWCKARALLILSSGDVAGASASMISDLGKWDGGPLYDELMIAYLSVDAMLFCQTPDKMRKWIEGFN